MPLPKTPLNRPLLIFILITILLAPFAVDAEKSVSKLTNLIDVAVFFLLYIAVKEHQQPRKYAVTLIFATTIASLYGILQHYLEIDLFRFSQPISFLKHISNDLSAPVRISAFSSYMTFGGQLAMILTLIFAYVLYSRGRWDKILWSIVFMINGLALIWTYTRSAWIGSALAMIVIGFMAKGKLFWKNLLLATLFLGMTIILQQSLDYHPSTSERHTGENAHQRQQERSEALPASGFATGVFDSNVVKRLFSIFELENNLERLYTWESSFRMFRDHLFTGIGHGNYSKACEPYRERYKDFEFTSRAHAHNMLLQTAVIGGIPLLGAFLWLWVVLFRSSYQFSQHSCTEERSSRALTLGVFGALIAFSVHGMFEHNFGDSEVLLMLWMLYACSLVLSQKTTRKNEEGTLI